jgi:NADH-quinone oxidoreductase subunit A
LYLFQTGRETAIAQSETLCYTVSGHNTGGGLYLLGDFGFVGLYIIAAILFSGLLVVLPVVFRILKLAPHNPTAAKTAPFECGMETIGKTWIQFNTRYYFYALIFVALDVLVVFIYPWAATMKANAAAGEETGLVAVLVFVGIILVGYLYAWKKRVLEWK